MLKDNNFKFSYSKINAGVCVGFNEAAKLATQKYILLGHDDMYFCPNWDTIFFEELKKLPDRYADFFLSGTMVHSF